ncbi:MAG: efflux transporter periplasmic adaptor subunit [Deltaproteobacteria bacterium]|nr:efflux transporter periplasmic adaptor subunit [Deltaproteobacteria bacterium]
MRAYVTAVLLLLVIFGAISGYLYRQSAARSAAVFAPPPVTIATAIAAAETWHTELEAVGTLRAVQGVELSVEESGEVIAIAVSSGDRVEEGQRILTLDDKVEQASRERQSASLKLARLLHEREAELMRQKSVSQSQYDRSKADFDRATAQLAETRARLENKRIHAPFSGTIGIVHVRTGDYVEPGDRIATLQDLTELEVDFTVPARHYPSLRPGLGIRVQVAAFPEKSFQATLRALDTQVDAGTRNLLLRATLEQGSGLLPGMFAQLRINLASPTEVVTLPETAVTYSLHGDTVFVIEGQAGELVATPRLVRTGDSRDGRVAILEGLSDGERVASVGQNKLFRGARVVVDDSVPLQ